MGQQGEARAKADLMDGLLQLQTFAKPLADAAAESARAQRLKDRWGLSWVYKKTTPTPLGEAFVSGYNRIMLAEIERRHGKAAVEELQRDARAKRPETAS